MSNPSLPDHPKKALRQQALDLRSQLPIEAISLDIRSHLSLWPLFEAAGQILFYHPFRNEVDLTPLVEQFPHKRWYLPTVVSKDHLEFFHYHPEHRLNQGKYGIQEPHTDSDRLSAIQPGDILLAPGLMFDRRGYRLGYGKGFFDKFLNTMAQAGHDLIRVGVAPGALVQPLLPADSWDIPMQYIATEVGILFAEGTQSP